DGPPCVASALTVPSVHTCRRVTWRSVVDSSQPLAPQPATCLRQRRNPMIRLFVLSAFLAFASAVHAQPARSLPELAGRDRGHPAEEMVSGANAMVKDGLFTRFPKPDFVLGLHDTSPRRRVRLDALRVGAGREARAGLDRDTHAA